VNICWLHMPEWHTIPTGHDWSTVSIEPFHNYAISFSTKTYRLIESPYPTNCIHYSKKTKYSSRNDCIGRCRFNESLSKCEVIVHETNVFKWQIGRFTNTDYEKIVFKNMNLDKICSDTCPHVDCVKSHFTTIERYKMESFSRFSAVSFKVPLDPQTVYWHKSKIETIEFLCYCASTIGYCGLVFRLPQSFSGSTNWLIGSEFIIEEESY